MNHEPFWHYRARIDEILTGCAFRMTIDQGFGDTEQTEVHLLGIETGDVQENEIVYNDDHAAWVREWIEEARARDEDCWPIEVVTFQNGGAGDEEPYLGLVYRQLDYESLQTALLREFGEEVAYPTPACPHRPAVELDGPRCQYCGMKMEA